MNPVALQHAKGNPFAPTSWGAFGPSWLVVSIEDAGQDVAVGQATEVETANPITPLLSREVVVGQASEAETANPVTVLISRVVSIGTATERELARTLTPGIPDLVAIGQATERELARVMTPRKDVPGQIGVTCAVLSPTVTCEVLV